MLKKIPNPILGSLFILLYFLSWTPFNQSYLIGLAFVPIFLLLDRYLKQNKSLKQIIGPLILIFVCSGLVQHLWISNAHWIGTVLATFVQTLLLILPFIFYYKYTSKGYKRQGYLSFILLFLSIEYAQNFWDLAWPWFNLGHSLSSFPKFIQWYQFTGSIGGTLFILVINIFIYNIVKYKTINKYHIGLVLLLITVFSINSTIIKPINNNDYTKVLVYQPNLDAYEDKFTKNIFSEIDKLEKLLPKKDSKKSTLIVCPETFIHKSIPQENNQSNPYLTKLRSILKNENQYLITGLSSTKKVNPNNEPEKESIRKSNNVYYKAYNSAVLLNKNETLDFYNKSKLVAGAETTPFASVLKPVVEKFFNLDLGGVSGNLGISDYPKNFKTPAFTFTPLICFESVFGDYTASFTEKGSDFITIITNDDWWGNTSGHRHHFELAKIRAIENQKYVVRSANTGISGIISPQGQVVKSLDYKEYGIIESEIELLPRSTYFARNKHLIGKLSTFVFIMLLLQMETLLLRTKKR